MPLNHHIAKEKVSPIEWLRQKNLRVTKGRQALVKTLLKTEAPLTLEEMRAQMQGSSCDFATVFRFIKILEKKRLVERHSWQDGQLRYVLVHEHHHHHLICKKCHKVEVIDTCSVKKLESDLKEQTGYKELSHSLEFFGLCPRCQKIKT